MNIGKILNALSYLQYPLIAVSMVYYSFFMISMIKIEINWVYLNNTLLFYGIAISLSSLQDTTKTQNNFSKKIWQNPKKGKIALIIMALTALFLIISGMTAYLLYDDTALKDVSIGLIVLGIGLIGLLKSANEMYENHRLDKS